MKITIKCNITLTSKLDHFNEDLRQEMCLIFIKCKSQNKKPYDHEIGLHFLMENIIYFDYVVKYDLDMSLAGFMREQL